MAKFFIHRPVFAWVLAIVTMLVGGFAVWSLPISKYPDIAPTTVGTGTDNDGNGSVDVWQQTVHVADGWVQKSVDTGANGSWDFDVLDMGPVSYRLGGHRLKAANQPALRMVA